MEKFINHVGLTVSASLKARETTAGRPFTKKYGYSIGRKCGWNYRKEIGMLSYIHGLTRPEILMDVQQCARF